MNNWKDDSGIADVTITFDGLMLFYFDARNKRCEVKFRRVDEHKIGVKVEKKDDPTYELTHTYGHDDLSKFDELWLCKGVSGKPLQYGEIGSTKKGGFYEEILQLDGKDFYGGKQTLEMKSRQYQPTLYLCDGEIGTTKTEEQFGERFKEIRETSPCYRVTDIDGELESGILNYSFRRLRYNMRADDWTRLREAFPSHILPIAPFSRWVDATINFNIDSTNADHKEDSLVLVGGNLSANLEVFPLVEEYTPGDKYWIHITHLDRTPVSLEDCKGMAHLSESFRLGSQHLYGVFAPNPTGILPIPSAPWKITAESSEVTCCKSARVDEYQTE